MLFFVVVTLLLFPNEGEFRDKAILKRNLSNELRRPFTGVIVREPGLSQRGVQVSLLFVPPHSTGDATEYNIAYIDRE